MNNSWVIKPVYRNVYIAGQIQSNYFPDMADLFSVFFNLRRGTVSEIDGEPTQEEVTLINVHDKTGTYTNEGRQKKENLLRGRIIATRPNEYIAFESDVNYQARNPLEFGDDIGYNETWSRMYIESVTSYKYIHTPIDLWAARARDCFHLPRGNQRILRGQKANVQLANTGGQKFAENKEPESKRIHHCQIATIWKAPILCIIY
ncbi:hypothetical protein CAPTEDRAFT_207329 [Capitella teleta]|uniref:Uncharacterized protein n=1 Tax=Capitella teleta TaxID=283909 RepID=R7UH09_CAPTE|nr:hypothetical protein CAPTEDRAFT_207329 [Capitella teleta]|eukprot:ELU05490.1 hypothetical protein CAPTEDRAFT_207329 [Capitella teleta]